MFNKLYKAFEENMARIKSGESVKTCLSGYTHLLPQLVPLLHTALSIEATPKEQPSADFKMMSKKNLLTRLHQEAVRVEKAGQDKVFSNVLWRGLERIVTGPAKVAIPLALVIFLALEGLFLFGSVGLALPRPASALISQCTLSTLNGSVELQRPGANTWEEAENGMTIEAGSWVKTTPNSEALLTFFTGTTIKLEPSTQLMVEQVEGSGGNQPAAIVLKQWLGKTLSRVEKLADPGSRYEIQTPSASAMVRGTQFVTEVSETGATKVQTIEGLVSVSAQGKEVQLPAGQQTTVEPGASPSEPTTTLLIPAEDGEPPAQSPASDKAPAQGQEGLPAQGQESGQGLDAMWWMVLGALVFSLGAAVFMWRRM